jgi:broad specificity phosphatase PhoE
MSQPLPIVYIARHGETAWTVSGQHTGRTDLPLTPAGERNARRLGERLKGMTFAKVFTSPLQRAVRTCELAGFGTVAELDPDLMEWDYGQYEGLRLAEILAQRPDWQLFRDGCPGGESPAQIGRARTALSDAPVRFQETSCCFPADTSLGSSPRAGSPSTLARAGILSSTRRA